MKHLYSVLAHASQEVSLTDPDVLLEAGVNVFTVTTARIEDVVARLENDLGVQVRAVHRISQPETTTVDETFRVGDGNDDRLDP